jgi:dienelactone hydrolase
MDRMKHAVMSRYYVMWLLLLTWPAHAGAPLDAYGRLPSIEQAALSPDGSKIAFIQTLQDTRLLVIFDMSVEKVAGGVRMGDEKIRQVRWADNDNLLITTASSSMPMELSGTKTEWDLMQVYNLKTHKTKGLLDHVHSNTRTMNVVYGRPVIVHPAGSHDTLLYMQGLYVDQKTTLGLFRINLTSGAEDLIRQGSNATQGWLVDDTGDAVAEQQYLENERRWAIRLLDGHRTMQTVSGAADIDSPDMMGLSAAGDAVIVALAEADGVRWRPLLMKDASWGSDLAHDESMTELLHKNGSQRMMGMAYLGDTSRYHFEDPELQRGWEWAERVFGFQRVEFVSVSADHARILLRVLGPKTGYGYYLADIKEHLTRPVGNVYDGVKEIAEVRAITYSAADGLKIPAYLTLPPDRPAKDLPVIVMPHGGPQARDILGFDWWAQALAAQGYAVLQPNYRGSDLGKTWVEAGYGEWGKKMQTDLSDGLAYLAAQGIVDAKRACIVGASYGGYAALAGVSLQSGIYRCAVAVAGVSDPANMLAWVQHKESYGDKLGLRYWERFMAVNDTHDKKLDAVSPLKHADQIKVPLMLIHGREDSTVPYDQSEDMAKALKRAGKSAEFVTLDKEDHYLSRSATRLQMLTSSVQFLKKYNPPD